jgi:hypothetical protein
MGLPEIKHNNISEYLTKTDIVQKTAEQIMKDFSMFGLTITFSGNTEQAYTELHHQLTLQVTALLENDYGRLLSVLYQVDISEKDIQKTHIELAHYSYPEIISHQILVRDLKKVLTREYFKSL